MTPICQNPACGREIPRPAYGWSNAARIKRRFCTKPCWDAYLRDKQLAREDRRGAVSLEDRLAIPDSARRVATRDGIPHRCPCGGLWKLVLDGAGVSCLTCGRDLFISAALAGLG